MVHGNVNLLERKAPSGLTSPAVRRAALWIGSAAAVGVVAYGLQTRELRALAQELARVQAHTERLQRTIAEVPTPDVALADRLAKEERDVQALEVVVRTLATGGLAHTAGFVATLQAFGRTTTEGVWLTGLSLDNRHGAMTVEGRALDASRVPALLQTLKTEPYFAGTTFSAIEMTAGAGNSELAADRALKFRISTPTADAESTGTASHAGGAPAPAG